MAEREREREREGEGEEMHRQLAEDVYDKAVRPRADDPFDPKFQLAELRELNARQAELISGHARQMAELLSEAEMWMRRAVRLGWHQDAEGKWLPPAEGGGDAAGV